MLSFQSKAPVDALYEGEDDGEPGDEEADQVQVLVVVDVCLLPGAAGEEPLQVHLKQSNRGVK